MFMCLPLAGAPCFAVFHVLQFPAVGPLPGQWELSAISISIVRQDVEDTVQQMGTMLIWKLSKESKSLARARALFSLFSYLIVFLRGIGLALTLSPQEYPPIPSGISVWIYSYSSGA